MYNLAKHFFFLFEEASIVMQAFEMIKNNLIQVHSGYVYTNLRPSFVDTLSHALLRTDKIMLIS